MMARQNMGRERTVSYSEMVRSNGGCRFVAGRKLYFLSLKCGDSGRISLRQEGQDR